MQNVGYFEIKLDPYGQINKETNGGSEKVMLDNTLVGTLEGFCNIRKGDVS